MFDSYYVGPQTVEVNSHVTEKRAPTDESVRLLREMESSAKAEVIKAIKIEGNEFKGVIHSIRDHLSLVDKYLIIFELNGKKHTVEAVCNYDDLPRDRIPKIHDTLASYIAGEILKNTKIEL